MELSEIISQLKLCKFRDEHGHALELNVGFIALVEMNWADEEKAPCPKCGSIESAVMCSDEGSVVYCQDCGNTWSEGDTEGLEVSKCDNGHYYGFTDCERCSELGLK